MRFKPFILLTILAIVIVGQATAAPTAPVVSTAADKATFTTTGYTGVVWFQWGQNQNYPEFRTPNTTTGRGDTSTGIYYPATTFYVRAYDITGSSDATTFSAVTPTPLTQTTFGQPIEDIVGSGFNTTTIATIMWTPFLWVFPDNMVRDNSAWALYAGLFVALLIVSMWFQVRRTYLPWFIGLLVLSLLTTQTAGLGINLPAEIQSIGQMCMVLALSGIIVSIIKK
jgi:hypothetical protein